MGAMFRSEEMALCLLFIQPEVAYLTVSELGESGIVQFRDLNADVNYFQRKFVTEVRRCDEMERKLRYIEAEVKKDGVFLLDDLKELPRAPNPREVTVLESCIEKTENDIMELSQNAVNLKSSFLELMELRHVLEKTQAFFTEEEVSDTMARTLVNEESQNITGGETLEFVAGVINRERMPAFERMLWRISRGNVFLRQAEVEKPLEDPTTGNDIYKTVFVAFFQGEQLRSRVKKVCNGFHASLCPCPSSHSKRMEVLKGVRTRIEDLKMVLNQTYDHRMRVLRSVAKELPNWTVMVKKMKAIYHTMNLFNMDVSKKCLIGECWVPMADLQIVQNCLTEGSRAAGGNSIVSFLNIIHTDENPPTFNRTNKFTRGFQNLIDAYGVASYRETNPALYTIITFPFLFSVMFGDAGHALVVLLFGAYMVLNEKKFLAKKTSNEIWNIFFGGRYIILLMGIFSMYTGIIYNDVFSKSVNVFGSHWSASTNLSFSFVNTHKSVMLDPKHSYAGDPYPIGIDPVWVVAENKILFLNSFKMKLSVILGVGHMIFGVCMNIFNIMHFKRYASFFLEFLPSLIFLLLMFGYLASIMFIKWILYTSMRKDTFSEACAPSLIITFVNMILQGANPKKENCDEFMFDYQYYLQLAFFGTSIACIPVLLFGKPIHFLLTKKSNKGKAHKNGSNGQDIELHHMNGGNSSGHHNDEDEDESFGEVMIHQAIHTVEYVLSTVSHTASYLRLWALSLAHAQLSEVLWSMVMKKGLQAEEGEFWKAGLLFITFGTWSVFTLAILVVMEGMSAFLHTLRLHWVEFMSKFYEGLGYPFQPFCFKTILDTEEPSEAD